MSNTQFSTPDLVIIGSGSDVKINAAQTGILAAGIDPIRISYKAPSHGNEQPFGAEQVLICAGNRANASMNRIVSPGTTLSGQFRSVAAIGQQTGILHTNFDDSLVDSTFYHGFTNDSWKTAEFFDRTATVLLSKCGEAFNRVTIWSTPMPWTKANRFIYASAMGGPLKLSNEHTAMITGGFTETVSGLLILSKSDVAIKKWGKSTSRIQILYLIAREEKGKLLWRKQYKSPLNNYLSHKNYGKMGMVR
jgi:hypothetical protein